jgi:16S rRNA (cytosine967-C5)-methyltransferase
MTIRRSPQDNVRVAAAWVVERTLASLAPTDSFLATVLERYDERDQALLRELVFGTLRWLRRIDQVITDASSRSFDNIEGALHGTLRVAVYQLLFLDRVPAHAAVHEAVEQAHCLTHRGAASFVNAVLRRIARSPSLDEWPVREQDPVRRLAIEYSHPDVLVERWMERLGETRTRELLIANNRPKPLQLLAFRHLGGREVLAETLIDEGLEVEPSALSPVGVTVRRGNPFNTKAFRRGHFYIQDEISQIAALLPSPRAGERILDAAAAPGGKSFALKAQQPEVRLTLSDVSPARIFQLRANLRRLRLDLPMLTADAKAFPAAAEPLFDRVVLDLPCCGTGTLRKNPELKWRISEREIGRLSRQGRRMMRAMAPLVKPGGLLVAITCSLEEEENEAVVERFLNKHSEFAPLPLEEYLEAPLVRWVAGPGFWRVLPGGDHDGFTVHVLQRRKTL